MVGAPFCMFIKAWEFSHATRLSLVISSPSFFASGPRFSVRCPFCHCPFQSLLMHLGWESTNKMSNAKNGNCQQTTRWWSNYPWLSRIMKHCSWMFWVLPILGGNDEQLLQYAEHMIIFPFLMAAHLLGRWMVCVSGHKDLPKVWAAKKGAGWFFRKERTTGCARFMFCLWGIWHITLFRAVEMI